MTAYTRDKPGAPENGRYQLGDAITDSNNVVWVCAKGGMAGYLGDAVFTAEPAASTGVGAVVGSLVTAVEQGLPNGVRKTTLTLAARSLVITNALAYGSSQLYTFPEGRILVLGCHASLALAVAGTRTGTINDNSTVDWALGSAAASNVALTSTMVDLCAAANEAAFAATGNGFGAVASSQLAAAAQLDGTSTALSAYLNFGFSDADDIDGDSTVTVNGTIVFHWIQLGDY
jgi:hypothetical protein